MSSQEGMEMNIAIDTGNKSIKTKHSTFVAGITERATEPTTSAKTDWIRYEGKYYVLSGNRGEYMKDKTINDRYFILSLFAIAKELEVAEASRKIPLGNNEIQNISLLVGLPPAHMEDRELKKKFQRYFHTDEPVQVYYNGRTWLIDVKSVRVYAQCFAALMSRPDILAKHRRILGIDIGGLTSDYMEFINGKINPDHTDSMENGVIPFYRAVQSECRKKFDAILDETAIDEMLLGEPGLYDDEMIEVVKNNAEKYTDKYLAAFREMGIDLKNTYVVFMGGGSILLWEFIKKSQLLKNFTLISDVKANAIGYDVIYRNMSRNVG